MCSMPPAAIGRPEDETEDHYTRLKTTYTGLPLSHSTFSLSYVQVRRTMQGKNPLPTKTVSPPLSYNIKQTSTLTPPFPYSPKLAQYMALLRTSPTELLTPGTDDHILFLWSPFLHQTRRPTNRLPAPNFPRRLCPGRSVGSVGCLG